MLRKTCKHVELLHVSSPNDFEGIVWTGDTSLECLVVVSYSSWEQAGEALICPLQPYLSIQRAEDCSAIFTWFSFAGFIIITIMNYYYYDYSWKTGRKHKGSVHRNHLVHCTCTMHRYCISTIIINALRLCTLAVWSTCLNSFFICNLVLIIWLISFFFMSTNCHWWMTFFPNAFQRGIYQIISSAR